MIQANVAFKGRSGRACGPLFRRGSCIPIIDLRGNVIAFGGRVLTDDKAQIPEYFRIRRCFAKATALFATQFCQRTRGADS